MKKTITSFSRRAAMVLLLTVLTMPTAWAQDPGDPDLGRIISDPAASTGGSLSFYYGFDYEPGTCFNQISIDGTTHMSDNLRSTDCQSVDEKQNCIFITGNPDATHVLSGYTITAKKANNENVAVYNNMEKDVYYFEMPADGSDVTVTATFRDMFFTKAKLGDNGHPHINFVTFDKTGKRQTVSTADLTDPVYVLDGSEKHLGQSGSETWYVAKSYLNYTTPSTTIHDCGIILDGTVHLILADGADVNTNCNDEHGSSINGNNNSLILYSQGSSASEGKFTIRGGGDYFVENISSFIINGGVVNSLSERYSQFTANNVTIRGGKVTFSREDEDDPAVSSDITILGGQVTVVGKMEGGNITLGWTDVTDFIKASSYEPFWSEWMKIADGQAMIADGTTNYSGMLDDSQIAAIGGKTLKPQWTGTGVDADHAYMINRPGELKLLAARVNGGETYSGKYFKLGADITFNKNESNNFTPIGDVGTAFSGTFDGQGYSISGIRISDPDGEDKAIFSRVGGTVKNLVVSDCRIEAGNGIGGIVAQLEGKIENCQVGSDVTLTGNMYVGGIAAGSYNGVITGCTSAATITGTINSGLKASYLGGIAGATRAGSTLKDNLFLGTIGGELKEYIGAITGIDDDDSGDANSFTNNAYTCEDYKGVGTAGSITGTDVAGTRKLKNIATCSATVPNPIYHSGYTHNFFYDGTWNDNHGGIEVYDGETLLTYGTDYRYKMMESLDGGNCENLNENCRVYLEGLGDYAGVLYKDVVIVPATVTNESWGSLTWSLDADGNFTISGTGAMDAAAIDTYPWYNYCSLLTSISIGEGITSIGNNAFGGVSGIHSCSNVTEVAIPSTVTSIGADAFKGCVGATDVYCFADPANLTWEDAGDDFKPATDPKDKTKCHVADGSDWSGFSNVNVTFVDDLADVCIPYIDANGTTAYCTDYTEINTSNMPTTLDAGWYVVTEDVTYTSTVTTTGDVTLILTDGKTMSVGTATDRIASGNSIFADKDYSLTIYGQTLQTGILNAFNSDKQAVYLKNYIQHGGNVTIDATNDDAIRLYGNDLTLTRGTLNVNTTANEVAISFYNTMTSFVTVTGGNLTATSSYSSIYGNLNMSGGTLTATGGINGNVTFTGGTATIDGLIWSNATLGWTNASDYITATSYGGTVTIADGKSLSDGTTTYNSGVLNDDQKEAIAGKTLRPAVKITLPTGVTATGTGVITQTDGTYALPGATATISAATDYIISNVNATGADLTDNGDDTYTFTVGTTDVTVTATVITNIVTQGNFDSYFDEYGYLLDAITFDELIFQGEFSNLVDYILLDRSITITGDNAVLNNMGFAIVSDDVSLNNMTLVSNTDLGYLIYVEASNVTLDNVSVTYNAPNYAEAKAIFANGAENFALTNSEIIFTGADPGENHYRALEVNNSNAAIIDNNTITATFPAVAVDWGKTGIDQDLVLAVGIQGGDDIEFTNNRVTVNTDGDIDSYPTIDAVMVYSAEDILIEGNDITHLDNTTEDGPRYYYSLDIYSTTGTVEANNIIVNTADIDRAGTAYPINLTGPFTVTVKDNNITAISKGPVAGIYATNWPGESNLTAENNIINVTGYATTSNYALVAGIEAEIDVLKASNNTITVANGADYDDANQVIGVGIGTSWFYGDTSADINGNNMTVDGKYAVYYTKAVDTNVTGNNLIAHELKGNDAVYIADGSGNTVENNVPATLFAAGSTNQWMTWCGTKELVTPENVTVYTVTGINNEDDNHSIILDDVTTTASIGTQTMKVIPAYTPVLIYRETVGNDALYGMFKADVEGESGVQTATGTTGCTFYGTTTALEPGDLEDYYAEGQTYILGGDKFIKADTNEGIAANKCWLVTDGANGARQLSIVIGDGTTAIDNGQLTIDNWAGAEEWYTIDGRKLNGKPTKKGLYINNGKKTVIK